MGQCLGKCVGKNAPKNIQGGAGGERQRQNQYRVGHISSGEEQRPQSTRPASALLPRSLSSRSNGIKSESGPQASTQSKPVGNKDLQRIETSKKTGVFAVQGEQGFQLTKDVMSIENLRTLHIENVGLKDVPALSSLATLQRLKLPRNILSSIPSIAALKALQQIDLSKNHLSSIPDSFSGMDMLKEANFSCNKLTSLPSSLGSCSSLKNLDASSNNISSLPSSFGKLGSLEDLNVSNNTISSLPGSFGDLKRIKRIAVQNNSLSSIPSGLLKNTPLADIFLDGNPVKDKTDTIDGWDKFLERNGRKEAKVVDQRVKAGDLSAGLGIQKERS